MSRLPVTRGKITASFIVRCGGNFCDKSTSVWTESAADARLTFISRGWMESALGFVCPECSEGLVTVPDKLLPQINGMSRAGLTRLRLDLSSAVAAARLNHNSLALADGLRRLKVVEDALKDLNMARSGF